MIRLPKSGGLAAGKIAWVDSRFWSHRGVVFEGEIDERKGANRIADR